MKNHTVNATTRLWETHNWIFLFCNVMETLINVSEHTILHSWICCLLIVEINLFPKAVLYRMKSAAWNLDFRRKESHKSGNNHIIVLLRGDSF